jgi:hypothetical protein
VLEAIPLNTHELDVDLFPFFLYRAGKRVPLKNVAKTLSKFSVEFGAGSL